MLTDAADLGLKLNEYHENYRETILKSLQAARKSTGKRTSLDKLFRSSKVLDHWSDKYPHLVINMEGIKTSIQKALECGKSTRDEFLKATFEILNEIAHNIARELKFEVHDTFSEDVLVERRFQTKSPGIDELWIQYQRRNYRKVET
jgi:hypothetical protein